MSMIPVTNNTDMPMAVGSHQVPAGETRHFPEHMVPAHLRQPAEVKTEKPINKLLTLLDNSIALILPELAGLTSDELDEIEQLEAENQKRKGIAKAIQEERLKRADQALNDEQEHAWGLEILAQSADEIAQELPALTDKQLVELSALELGGFNRADIVEAIGIEQANRENVNTNPESDNVTD